MSTQTRVLRMIGSYFKFIAKGALGTLLVISNSYASSVTQPNSMPSCTVYKDIDTCNTSKNNKGKGSPCMFLFPDTSMPTGSRGTTHCQSIQDTETADHFRKINIKEIVDLYPDLYEYDKNSNIGNSKGQNFENEKRNVIVGGFVQGYMTATLNLEAFHKICVEKKGKETCDKIVFDRNKHFMILDAENRDTGWDDEDTASFQWEKIEAVRSDLIAAELAGRNKHKDVTEILTQIHENNKANKQASRKAASDERKLIVKKALEKEKADGADATFDEQCRSNTSGADCRKATLSRSGSLSSVNCVWTHNDGIMGGGVCRYANSITCDDLSSRDCAANSDTLRELNGRLLSAGTTVQCDWSNRTCSRAR